MSIHRAASVCSTVVLLGLLLGAAIASGASVKDFPVKPINWISCPGGLSQNSQCASAQVPLDWKNPTTSPTITIFYSVFNSGGNPKNFDTIDGVVWYLDLGCSGVNSNDVWTWMGPLSNAADLAIVVPHMRGDGLSVPRLSCPFDESGAVDPPTVQCAQQLKGKYNESLQFYSLENAVNDISYLVSTVNTKKPNYLFGSRYGSFWAQRAFAAAPTTWTRTALASYTNPMAYDFFAAFSGREAALREVLSVCAADAQCAGQLGAGANVQATLDRVLHLAEHNLLPCNAALEDVMGPRATNVSWREAYSGVLAAMISPAMPWVKPDPNTVTFVLPILYRLQRCDPHEDVPVLKNVYAQVVANRPAPAHPANISAGSCYPSSVLRANILFNELTRADPAETVQYLLQASTLRPDAWYLQGYLDFYTAFPTYATPASHSNDAALWYPAAKANEVLKVAGAIDAFFPIVLASTTQMWPQGPPTEYATLNSLPGWLLDFKTTVGTTDNYCVAATLETYFKAPNFTLSTCLTEVMPLDWACTQQQTLNARQTYFGNNVDAWQFALPTSGTWVIPGISFTTLPPTTTVLTTIEPHHTTHRPVPPPNRTLFPPAAPDSSSNTGAIVGGIVGGILGIALIVVIVYKFCWRSNAPTPFSTAGGAATAGYASHTAHVQYPQGSNSGWGGSAAAGYGEARRGETRQSTSSLATYGTTATGWNNAGAGGGGGAAASWNS